MKTKAGRKKGEGQVAPLMAVGTFVVDYHKVIDHYPEQRSAGRVQKELVSNGGAPLNVLVNLARMKVGFPLFASARVGRDLDGNLIRDLCDQHGIDTSQVTAAEEGATGYTDVFTVASTGQHTCFHCSGIGDSFSRKDVRLRAVLPKILFLGSLGALGRMDTYRPEYGRTGSAQLVRDARKRGITTVVELCPIDRTSSLDDYKGTLKQADYLIISHRLLQEMVGIDLLNDGIFDSELAREAAERLIKCGLRKGAVIHCGPAAVFLGHDGQFFAETGPLLPAGKRAGSAGVDHAFAAGFLEGLYHEKPFTTCLKQGLAVSMACRRELTPSGGIKPLEECLREYEESGSD